MSPFNDPIISLLDYEYPDNDISAVLHVYFFFNSL